jgi:hypothetical protein
VNDIYPFLILNPIIWPIPQADVLPLFARRNGICGKKIAATTQSDFRFRKRSILRYTRSLELRLAKPTKTDNQWPTISAKQQ